MSLSASQTERNCYGQTEGPYYSDSIVWDTNPSNGVATIDEYGLVEAVEVGSTGLRGSLDFAEWENMGLWCQDYSRNIKRTAPVEVVPPCAYPVNFRQDGPGQDIGNGKLKFIYRWDSSNADLGSLSTCTVGELVNYPNNGLRPSPPFPAGAFPNPFISSVNGNLGAMSDTHSPTGGSEPYVFVSPYSSSSFTADEIYRYSCGCISNGEYVTLTGSLSIVRSVSASTGSTWKYTVSKSGSSATIDPLP